MVKNDELSIYRGKDFVISDKIKIHQPTLEEICEWGEDRYFSFIYTFVGTPTDRKYELHLAGIDWNEITDYDLFLFSYKAYDKSNTEIIFGELDFQSFEIFQNTENQEIVLYNRDLDIVIDRSIHEIMCDYLRKSHNISKNVEKAMTETTKEVLLDEAKDQIEMNKNKKQHSLLLPLISTMVNIADFKYGWFDVWGMKINAFMDSVTRVQHIKNADLLLSSGYSGFGVDLKKINKNNINYFYSPE